MNLNTYISKSMTYPEYYALMEKEAASGHDYAHYTQLNLKRMNRVAKTFKFTEEELQSMRDLHPNCKLLIITEGWCGDASQIIPVVEALAQKLEVQTHYVLRDRNQELMQNYLTNGAQSIPIIIGVSDEGEELFRFGPRTQYGMDLLKKYKSNPEEYTKDDFSKDLQQYYNKNKGRDIVSEFIAKFKALK